MKMRLTISMVVLLFLSAITGASCPSADITSDCKVDLEDFAMMASQWLEEGEPLPVLNGMTWVSINDPGVFRHEGFKGEMSKYETTNAQYCQYLNSALASGDVIIQAGTVYGNSGPYDGEIYYKMNSRYAQISWNGSIFHVETRDGYDMADHPVVEVSWYGATAFASYYGWRLPTEWEWQAVADYDGSFTYGCGTTINQGKANYYENGFANPLDLSDYPYTNPVN